MTRGSLPPAARRALEQRLGLVGMALHGVREGQVVEDRGLIGRQRQRALVAAGWHRDSCPAWPARCRARRSRASPGWSGSSAASSSLWARLTWSNSSASRPYSLLSVAMAGIEVGSLLQHRQRLALLAHGLEIAGVGERLVGVARFLGELLARQYPSPWRGRFGCPCACGFGIVDGRRGEVQRPGARLCRRRAARHTKAAANGPDRAPAAETKPLDVREPVSPGHSRPLARARARITASGCIIRGRPSMKS